jgi:hypothetical protein
MMTRAWWGVFGLFAACAGGAGHTGLVAVLGVEPEPLLDGGPSPSSFTVYAAEQAGDGGLAAPDPSRLQVQCAGASCACAGGSTYDGGARGVLAIIVDDSGSNSASAGTCRGCPTDPDGVRVTAINQLAATLLARAPGWRLALFDFGFGANGGLKATRLLAGYTSYPESILAGTVRMREGSSTYLYDSVDDALASVAGERAALDGGALPARVLLVTDGEDTSSVTPLGQVIARAQQLGVVVDTVGYGGTVDGGAIILASSAFRDLRYLARSTGGLVTFVPTPQLPALFDRLADALVGGYSTRSCTLPPGATAVGGSVGLEASTAPFWFEVAP